MRAIIIDVVKELEGRIIERSLPPEHRVIARRGDPLGRAVELIVEGPMLPEVVDGKFERGDLLLTMHCDDAAGLLRLEAFFLFSQPNTIGERSAIWEIGRWSSRAEMEAALR